MEWEDKREDVVRYALREAINGMESVAGKRGWHYPLVVRFVNGLIDSLVVQAAVDEVDPKVGEHQEQR